jgi:hypothetical protein
MRCRGVGKLGILRRDSERLINGRGRSRRGRYARTIGVSATAEFAGQDYPELHMCAWPGSPGGLDPAPE